VAVDDTEDGGEEQATRVCVCVFVLFSLSLALRSAKPPPTMANLDDTRTPLLGGDRPDGDGDDVAAADLVLGPNGIWETPLVRKQRRYATARRRSRRPNS